MIVLNHGGSLAVPDDIELARERVHPATMAAEGPLHELGAIGIVNSDSQGMGRIMESVRRTLQLAHIMKAWVASPAGAHHPGLPAVATDRFDDTERVLRYLAKVTVEPSIVHGVADHVGSLRAGRLADIVLWKPAWFGVKPELVLKSGFPAWAPLGDGNATVERAEPTRYRPDWGGTAPAAARLGVTFAAASAADSMCRRSPAGRDVVAIGVTRGLSRGDLVWNRSTAPIEIDPADGRVSLAGRPLGVAPVEEVPLSRRYLLR
jgi:urease subunit alpha